MNRGQGSSAKFIRVCHASCRSLLAEETQRDKRYLYKNIDGYLSYRHIRNQMAEMPLQFSRFKELRDGDMDTQGSK
jgi:hypothetical protein